MTKKIKSLEIYRIKGISIERMDGGDMFYFRLHVTFYDRKHKNLFFEVYGDFIDTIEDLQLIRYDNEIEGNVYNEYYDEYGYYTYELESDFILNEKASDELENAIKRNKQISDEANRVKMIYQREDERRGW